MAAEKKTITISRKEITIYVIWFVLVIAWNYGWPHATPAEDVIAAVVLAVFIVASAKLFKAHLE